jgi:hypothetical protein
LPHPTIVVVTDAVPSTATVKELILDVTRALIRPRTSSRALAELLNALRWRSVVPGQVVEEVEIAV